MPLREEIERQGKWLFKWRSYLPLLFIPLIAATLKHSEIVERLFGDYAGDIWESFAVAISFIGLGIRALTVGYVPRGTSGRNTQYQVAEALNTTGMYSITRNPLYLSNFVIILGVTLFMEVWWLALIVWGGFWLYYERIIFTEEEFLRKKFGDKFIAWSEKTPMVIPNFRNWRKPDLPFSFKTVVRREFSTYLAIVAVYFFIELAQNVLIDKHLFVHSSWQIFFMLSMMIYFVCLYLKKKTHVLDVAGR